MQRPRIYAEEGTAFTVHLCLYLVADTVQYEPPGKGRGALRCVLHVKLYYIIHYNITFTTHSIIPPALRADRRLRGGKREKWGVWWAIVG